MANPEITARMTDYFTRQIAWFEQLLADLAPLDDSCDDAAEARLSEQTSLHVKGTDTLGREFWALLREWEAAAGISEAERAQVAVLAQRAGRLAHKLAETYKRGESLLGERLAKLEGSLNELRKGRHTLRKYSVERRSDTGYIDKKA